jgi:hypothetical protein
MHRGFTKLFNTIVTSTIWQEDDKTRIVWITMLAIADANGIVSASIPGLASVANVEVDAARVAVQKFEQIDPDSRTKDFDGRRIEPIEGGWRILNYFKYRRMLSQEERREYKAHWIAERRRQLSTNVDASRQSRPKSTQAEAEEEDKETRVHASNCLDEKKPGNWLANDDVWIELEQILSLKERQKHVGIWIARIKENRPALYEAVCDFKDKRNQRQIKNPAAWLTQRYQHFKQLAEQRNIIRETTEKFKAQQ